MLNPNDIPDHVQQTLVALEHSIDLLSRDKAARHETDLLADAMRNTLRRIDVLESRCTQLANQHQVVMHTALPVDPRTVLPIIQPLADAIERLQLAIGAKDRLARSIAGLVHNQEAPPS